MDVMYCLTRNLYSDLLCTARSLREHNDATLHVICEDDSIDGLDARFYNLSRQTYFTIQNYRFTYMSFARVLSADLIDTDRVIYLDVDTIVCDSLAPMLDVDLTGKWFAAVPEANGWYNPYKREHYFNAGVLVMNLEQMRKDKATPQLVEAINSGRFHYGEQDVINGLFYDKIVPLPTRYNESDPTGKTNNPAVIHFAGIPHWQTANIYRKEYRDRYFR